MQRKVISLLVLPLLALGACGAAETERGEESPRLARAESPAPSTAEPTPPAEPAETPLDAEPAGEATHVVASGTVVTEPAATPAAERAAEPVRQEAADPASEILRRIERAYSGVGSMEAEFVQHLNVPLLGTNQRSEGKLYQRRPDRFLMRFTDPAGDVMVADGQYFWMYNPSVDRTQVLRTRMGDGSAQVDLQQEFLSNPTERYVPTLLGTESVDGRAAHVLTLVPKGRSPYRLIKVWVDQQDHLVRRFEMTEENETVRRVELRNLRLNVELADSLFRFEPPPGTQVFDT